ncbi:MAG: DUF3108 domain-containing protein [Calditrichia bacterium]
MTGNENINNIQRYVLNLSIEFKLTQLSSNNNAFHVGEKLSFNVRYGFIKAGEATMEVKGKVPIGDREAYEIISTANSTGTFDFFFKVRDRVESYIDTKGLFSWKFNKKLREGSYKFDLLVDYDQYNGKALVDMIRYNDNDDDSLTIRKQENFTVDIPPYVLDILAAFYYVRTQKLRIGMPIYLSNHDNKKVYDLRVIVQKRETIKVKAGKFRCIMVQPQLRGEAIFKQKGELWVWLSDDKYKIPVQMKSAVFVGSITTELTKIEGIKLPLPSQIK